MRSIILTLALLPALVALGHDAYLFYINQDSVIYEDGEIRRFFASFGFLWTTYHLSSYETVIKTVSPETWSKINVVLSQKAFFVGLGFAGLVYLIMLVLWFFGVGRQTYAYGEDGKDSAMSARAQKKLEKYKKNKK